MTPGAPATASVAPALSPASAPVVVLAAHPDDETIGAGALLHRLRGPLVVHLTDGAPREARFRSAPAEVDRDAYARLRRQELTRALAAGGVPTVRAVSLGAADQEAALAMADLARAFARVLADVGAAMVVTHPYEGGHPDHDAAALAARAAIALLRREGRRAPRLVEMTSYHAPGGRLAVGRFLPAAGGRETVRALTPAEQEVKRAMLACFESQERVLAPFMRDLACERFRPAPPARFGRAPHDGPLWYERLELPVSGTRWRALARRALASLRLEEDLP
jgi:N-acetylglucosamine malate deacetylase 2